MTRILLASLTLVAIALLNSASPRAAAQGLQPQQQLARDLYRQLIEIDTTLSSGSTTVAAEAMAARFKAAGFPDADMFIGGADPKKGNLVVRYRGRGTAGRKPTLLLAQGILYSHDVQDSVRALSYCGDNVRREQTGCVCPVGQHDDQPTTAKLWRIQEHDRKTVQQARSRLCIRWREYFGR